MRSGRLGAALGVAALLCGPVEGHAFKTGSAYPQFVEGAGLALASPVLLLMLVPLGLTLALWREDGLVAAWGAFLCGLAAGVVLAPLVSPMIAAAALAGGACCAVLAAGGWAYPPLVARLAATCCGALASMAMLEGHGLGDVPPAILAGVLFGANLILAAAAGLAGLVMARLDRPIASIAVRVAASWAGAMAILLAAFTLRG